MTLVPQVRPAPLVTLMTLSTLSTLTTPINLMTLATDRQLFVYYRVAEPALAATVAAVRAMQAALAEAHAGLHADLLRRPELRDGAVTLMETYSGALPPGLATTLAAATNDLPQPRHLEWFEPPA